VTGALCHDCVNVPDRRLLGNLRVLPARSFARRRAPQASQDREQNLAAGGLGFERVPLPQSRNY
jgi:hypothetical protein